MKTLESGDLLPVIEIVTDAFAVFSSLEAEDACTPAEAGMKVHLLSVRDRLRRGILNGLWWSDTRDMLADGMTKGGIPRDNLLAACLGTFCPKHDHKSFSIRAKGASKVGSNRA